MKPKISKLKSIVLCPRYKKRYEMEVVSYKNDIHSTEGPKIITTYLCPACGDVHAVEV